MVVIREIGEDELEAFAAVRNAIWDHDPLSPEDFVDWRTQAEDMVWLTALDGDDVVGSGLGIHGWHSPPGEGHLDVHVLDDARRRGKGSMLLARLGRWLREHGCDLATAGVYAEDAASLGRGRASAASPRSDGTRSWRSTWRRRLLPLSIRPKAWTSSAGPSDRI